VQLARKVFKDHKVLLAQQALLAHKVLELTAQQGLQVLLVPQVRKVLLAQLGLLAHKG
jgi:hypothetical protein